MPDLRVVTWNSTGENPQKALELQAEIAYLNATYAANPAKIILLQEGKQAANGDIYNMLNTDPANAVTQVSIGPNYQRPIRHITEDALGGRGYTVVTSNDITVNQNLTLHNYANDVTFQNFLNTQSSGTAKQINQLLSNMRPPAAMQFTYGGETIRLITWHAPLGPSTYLSACQSLDGKGTLDAFFFLDQSSLINDVNGIDLIIVAGDLNATSADLSRPCGQYVPLRNFTGETVHLDHIMGYSPMNVNIGYYETRTVNSSSVHGIMSSRIHW